jgi:Lon protease-like protein|tara:strand:- start:66 stop:692 length:627 start_codon:yes stop_codon:yes gene_type:complete
MSEKLPEKIPVFPLRGAIFFPETNLPLNIFEDRYLKMVENAISTNGFIGMIQSKEINGEVFKVGCLGKINKHEKTNDGRILINLNGLTRFKIDKEINNNQPFREFSVDYEVFKNDTNQKYIVENETYNKLILNSKKLFAQYEMSLNWSELSKLKKSQQIYTLAMISPFSVSEKQKLLEIPQINDIAKTFIDITKFAFYESSKENNIIQ